MKEDITTSCVMCGKQFRGSKVTGTVLDAIPTVELKTETLQTGIERTFYLCPHCGFKYTVLLTDCEIRELMKKRDKMNGYAKYKRASVRLRKKREYEEIDKEIKVKLNKLNGK